MRHRPSKKQLADWLALRWADVVPAEQSRLWGDREARTLVMDQLDQTIATVRSVTDDRFASWLLDEAEVWQQQLMLQAFVQLLQSVKAARPGDPILGAVAHLAARGHSLRSVLLKSVEVIRQG